MSTNKPRIQCILDENTYQKFKKLCENEERSESKMAARMIKQYIENYEKEEGRINGAELSNIKIG